MVAVVILLAGSPPGPRLQILTYAVCFLCWLACRRQGTHSSPLRMVRARISGRLSASSSLACRQHCAHSCFGLKYSPEYKYVLTIKQFEHYVFSLRLYLCMELDYFSWQGLFSNANGMAIMLVWLVLDGWL